MKLVSKRIQQLRKSKVGIFLLCLLIMGGCMKKPSRQSNSFAINQQEAKLIDIPIPLYEKWLSMEVDDSNSQDTTIFGYHSLLSETALIDFYLHEMERLGWRQLAFFQGTESLLQFESPERLCSISIRSIGKQVKNTTQADVVIFVGRKQS